MICEHCLECIGAAYTPSHLTLVARLYGDAAQGAVAAVEHYQCGDCGTTFVHQPAFGATTLAWLMGSVASLPRALAST